MHVQRLSFYNGVSNNIYNKKPKIQKHMTNPTFTGQSYDIEYLSGGTGIGPGCTVYDKNKNILTQSHSNMYSFVISGVENAVKTITPGEMKVEEVKELHGKGTLYVADPDETITDEIRSKHNYIATERQPKIPRLSDLDTKFHTHSEDNTDYNKEFGKITDYYSRMLAADTKEKNRYEIKLIEDRANLKKAVETKRKLESGAYSYYVPDVEEEKNKQDYFIYVNREAIRDDKEKIDYYNYKNNLTQQKIDFSENLTNIINKTGDAFIKRDIIARKRNEHIEDYRKGIRNHIDIMTQIRLTQAEKEHLEHRIIIMQKKHKALSNQRAKGNSDHYYFGYNSTGVIKSDKHIHTYYEETQEANAQLAEYDNKLKELTQKRHEIQKRIHNEKIKIKEYSDQIQPILDRIEPIYQELKAYYEANCPFSKEEFRVY